MKYVIVYNGLVLVEQGYYATYAAAHDALARWVVENKYCDGQYRVVGLRRVK